MPGTDGAVITYNRQSTVYGGLYVRVTVRFDPRP